MVSEVRHLTQTCAHVSFGAFVHGHRGAPPGWPLPVQQHCSYVRKHQHVEFVVLGEVHGESCSLEAGGHERAISVLSWIGSI